MQTPIASTLKAQQHPLVRQVADRIEATWQHFFELSPYFLPSDLGYVEGKLDGERVAIENRCYQTRQFRKLHLELARVGDALDVLHCVMFPRPEYPLPLFGCDVVGGRKQVGAAIVDLSPANGDRALSDDYQTVLSRLPEALFSQPRELPDWGDIFSEFCLFVRPANEIEEQRFLERVGAYLDLHCQRAIATPPLPERKAEILASQKYYCDRQRKNDKTRRVLEKAFGEEWAERYMTTVLFDLPEEADVAIDDRVADG